MRILCELVECLRSHAKRQKRKRKKRQKFFGNLELPVLRFFRA